MSGASARAASQVPTTTSGWRSRGDDRAVKTFRNTVLGEAWQESGEAPDWRRLYDRREDWEPGTVPAGGLLLTAGVDIQRDRLEASVWAWGQDRRSWLVEHRVLVGNPFETMVWDELRALLSETWRHAWATGSGWRWRPSTAATA
jgi:phage terminase large subunit GpA-like protein